MAIYLGSKEIDVFYDIESQDGLNDYMNRVKTTLNAEELEGIVNIRNYAFYEQTSLRTVTLPSTVESIGDYAFDGCSSVSYVRFLSETPPTLGRSSLPTKGGMRWYVPSGCLEVYQNAAGFSDYTSYLKEW